MPLLSTLAKPGACIINEKLNLLYALCPKYIIIITFVLKLELKCNEI